MSSANDKKRAASPAGTPPAPKRSQITASPEMTSDIADDREESTTTSVAMHSRAVAELFPEHYAASNGRVSPRHASEMTEEHQLAVAVARFRPLDGPLPAGFDIESLPVYRGPMSHLSMTAVSTGSDARVTPNATAPEESAPVSAPEDDAAVNEPAATAVDDPIAVDSTPEAPEDQICHWASCTKTFSGFNGPTLLWLHLTNEHVPRPFIDGGCKWTNCSYSNTSQRRFLLSHVGTHVPDYKPLVCDVCGRGFQQPSHLVSHKRTHR